MKWNIFISTLKKRKIILIFLFLVGLVTLEVTFLHKFNFQVSAVSTDPLFNKFGNLTFANCPQNPCTVLTAASSVTAPYQDITSDVHISGNAGVGTNAPAYRLDVNGDINGTNYLRMTGKNTIQNTDTWLRLNQDGAYTSGVHTPGLFAPGALNVGGVNGWGNPGGGNAWVAGRLGTNGYDPNVYTPSGWAGGISTADVVALATVRAAQVCLGGGFWTTTPGDCRTAWPSASTTPRYENISLISERGWPLYASKNGGAIYYGTGDLFRFDSVLSTPAPTSGYFEIRVNQCGGDGTIYSQSLYLRDTATGSDIATISQNGSTIPNGNYRVPVNLSGLVNGHYYEVQLFTNRSSASNDTCTSVTAARLVLYY